MAKVSQNLRRKVEERANGICEYCRSNSSEFFPDILMECDHVIPTSKGGENIFENLAFCCRRCNLNKFNETEGIDTYQVIRSDYFILVKKIGMNILHGVKTTCEFWD